MSPELDVMFSPARGYARLREGAPAVSPVAALRRPAIVALVLGGVTAMAATNRVDAGLVLSTTLCWSFVPMVQMTGGLVLILSSSRRTMTIAGAMDALFAAHGPWSLWMLAFALWAIVTPALVKPVYLIALTAIIPTVWTPIIVFAFCRVVLGESRRRAAHKTLLHQGAMIGIVLAYVAVAVQAWPRVINWWRP